jgi:hypothetical protein
MRSPSWAFGKLASNSTLVARSQSFSPAGPLLRRRTLALRPLLCLGFVIQGALKSIKGAIAFNTSGVALVPEREVSPAVFLRA